MRLGRLKSGAEGFPFFAPEFLLDLPLGDATFLLRFLLGCFRFTAISKPPSVVFGHSLVILLGPT